MTKGYFHDLLRQAGYKATAGRLKILEVLQAQRAPLSIRELIQKVEHEKIDQATVYRVLGVLEKMGVVRQVNLRHGHADYEFVSKDDHHHLVCIKCGHVEDVPGCDSEQVARQALSQTKGFSRVTQHSFEFFGVCKACDAH